MILWSYDPMILWSCDPMILWSYDPMILGWCVATRKPYNTKIQKQNQCQQPMKPNPNTSYNVNPCVTNLRDIANPNTTYNSNHKNLQCLAFVLLKWHVYTVGLLNLMGWPNGAQQISVTHPGRFLYMISTCCLEKETNKQNLTQLASDKKKTSRIIPQQS